MAEQQQADRQIEFDLRNPLLAAGLAWLLPGAGHFYQRRYAKGLVFSICILGTYFFGLAMGGGHVVYASVDRDDLRWQYAFQLGVGVPALPALEQSRRAKNGLPPLLGSEIMAPPQNVRPLERDELADWNEEYHSYFELGTLYTMIAGLLNVLAIYDAAAGPFIPPHDGENRGPPGNDKSARKRQEE